MGKENNQDRLLEAVFAKAREEGAPDSGNGIATHIYAALDNSIGQPISVDSIRGYYKRFSNNEDFKISQTAKDHLSVYLGRDDFKDFIKKDTTKSINKKRYQFLIVILILVIAFFAYDRTRKKCMIWDTNRFVKIHCDEVNAKPIKNEAMFNSFKMLEAECKTDFFFEASGEPKVWYYKKGKGDLELFNMPGIHPVNGKTLNDITPYMVETHICDGLE